MFLFLFKISLNLWTDEELYKKYSLTEAEISFIESKIRPMEPNGDGIAEETE